MKEIHMQGNTGMLRKSTQEFLCQSRVERTDFLIGNGCIILQKGPIGYIDHDTHQSLIHRQMALTIPRYPALIPQGIHKRLPQTDTDILNRVVVINQDIALAGDGQIEKTVDGKERQHMIEERDTGIDLGPAGSVKHQLQPDIRLSCRSLDAAFSFFLRAH